MRTSLNNIKTIDDYLLGGMAPGDAVLFEANMILNKDLKDDVRYQQHSYDIIRRYSRKKIKEEIAAAHNAFTAAPQNRGLVQRIAKLFKKD